VQHSDIGTPPKEISAVRKALLILEAFDGPHKTMGVTELSKQLSMPKPTIHRLLTDLVDAGVVDKLPWGRYQVGMRLFELGTLAQGAATLRSLALPHLHGLYRDTGYTVYLTVTDQGQAIQIERLPAPNRPQIQARWGGRWSLHCSSGGKVLLAFGAADVESYVEHIVPLTKYSIRDVARLRAELDTVRSQGYALSQQESLLGVYGVAVPVYDSKRMVVAAVGIAGHEHSMTGLYPAVLKAGEAVSAELSRQHWTDKSAG
jgi:DNA-binding IclR family transcriptional regulator